MDEKACKKDIFLPNIKSWPNFHVKIEYER